MNLFTDKNKDQYKTLGKVKYSYVCTCKPIEINYTLTRKQIKRIINNYIKDKIIYEMMLYRTNQENPFINKELPLPDKKGEEIRFSGKNMYFRR
jgi:hypothetical protein